MAHGSVKAARDFFRAAGDADERGVPMRTNVISYRGYHAEIKYDPSADAFHARVLGLSDVISFYGRTPEELRQEMQAAIEDYLAWCEADGAQPEKSWTGKLTCGLIKTSVGGS